MRFCEIDKKHEFHLKDESDTLLGKGFIYVHEAAKFYDRPRMNYFIEFELDEQVDMKIGKEMVMGLVEVAKKRRKDHPNHEAGVYNCSFADDVKMIANLIVFIDNNGNGFLEDMFVANDHRGNQLGMFLVDYAANYMKESGVERINLEVWSANKKAYCLYKKMGYDFVRETETSIGMSI